MIDKIEKPLCLHQKAVCRVRTISRQQLRDVEAGWMTPRFKKSDVILAATVEAPVMGSDGIVESRTAEWLFGAIHVIKTSICLHLGADAFINASPILRSGGFYFTRSDWDSKREPLPVGSADFMVAPMIFRGILESEAIHIPIKLKRSHPLKQHQDSDLSKIEKRLRMIVDPKGYLEKDTCRMATAAVFELQKCVAVISVMDD